MIRVRLISLYFCKYYFFFVFKFLFIKLPLALIALSVLLVVIFKWAPVWVTPIMVHRSIQYRNDPDYHTSKKWVKLEDISPEMMKAVISSEDNLFCKHNGFDEKAIRQSKSFVRLPAVRLGIRFSNP